MNAIFPLFPFPPFSSPLVDALRLLPYFFVAKNVHTPSHAVLLYSGHPYPCAPLYHKHTENAWMKSPGVAPPFPTADDETPLSLSFEEWDDDDEPLSFSFEG